MFTNDDDAVLLELCVDRILRGIATDFGIDFSGLHMSAQQSLNELSVELLKKSAEDIKKTGHLRVIK